MGLAWRPPRQIIFFPFMEPLEPPASHHVKAAIGWIELGNVPEAFAELERIPGQQQSLPAVQASRLDCLIAGEKWNEAVILAKSLCDQYPEEVGFWLHHAYATRRCEAGGIKEAYEILAPCVELFPDEWLIAYNVACYLCRLDRLGEAVAMLKIARAVGGEQVDELARDDEDLIPLREL